MAACINTGEAGRARSRLSTFILAIFAVFASASIESVSAFIPTTSRNAFREAHAASAYPTAKPTVSHFPMQGNVRSWLRAHNDGLSDDLETTASHQSKPPQRRFHKIRSILSAAKSRAAPALPGRRQHKRLATTVAAIGIGLHLGGPSAAKAAKPASSPVVKTQVDSTTNTKKASVAKKGVVVVAAAAGAYLGRGLVFTDDKESGGDTGEEKFNDIMGSGKGTSGTKAMGGTASSADEGEQFKKIEAEQAERKAQEKAKAEKRAQDEARAADEARINAEKAKKEQEELAKKKVEEAAKIEAEKKAAQEREALERQKAEEAERVATEERKKAEEAKRVAAEQRVAEEKRKAEEAARIAAERKAAEEKRKAEEAARIVAEKKAAEEKRKAEEAARIAAEKKAAEEKRKAEEAARIAAEKRAAEEKRKAEEAERIAAQKAAAEARWVKENLSRVEKNPLQRRKGIENALKQPKSPEEERKLAEHYASMSVEDRAFNILLDLGMIEPTPDPDDPDYDSTNDHDFAEENSHLQ